MPFLQTKDLPVDGFVDLIKRFSPPADDAWLIAFSPAKAIFEKYHFDEALLLESDHDGTRIKQKKSSVAPREEGMENLFHKINYATEVTENTEEKISGQLFSSLGAPPCCSFLSPIIILPRFLEREDAFSRSDNNFF